MTRIVVLSSNLVMAEWSMINLVGAFFFSKDSLVSPAHLHNILHVLVFLTLYFSSVHNYPIIEVHLHFIQCYHVLCDLTDLIWRNRTPFEAMTRSKAFRRPLNEVSEIFLRRKIKSGKSVHSPGSISFFSFRRRDIQSKFLDWEPLRKQMKLLIDIMTLWPWPMTATVKDT